MIKIVIISFSPLFCIIVYLLVKLFKKPKRVRSARAIIEGRQLSISSASEIDSDFEDGNGADDKTMDHFNTSGQWTVNPSYCNRDNVGSFRSRESNIYSSIKSVPSIRRPSDRCNVQSGNETFEVQPLLNSYPKEKKGKDNPTFEADDVIPDYPRAKMTQITVYDTENTEEEKIQKNCQYAPYNFTSFNETAQGRYTNDAYVK